MKESDMYEPIKAFFLQLGYDVKSEVHGCDITMTKDGELLVVEMKKTFNMTLLFQLLKRQKMTSQVYAAIPRPVNRQGTTDFAYIKQIVSALGIGLITIRMDSAIKSIDIVSLPDVNTKKPRRNGLTERERVIKEASARTLDLNTGGQTGKKLVTAYRERAINAAAAIAVFGASDVPTLREKTGLRGIGQMFRDDFYGWFAEADDQTYTLTPTGANALTDPLFAPLVSYYSDKYSTLVR